MSATTVKIEDPLLRELKHALPKAKTLTSFIREILERDMRQRKLALAAKQYAEMLEADPEERKWLEEWEVAELAKPPVARPAKKANK